MIDEDILKLNLECIAFKVVWEENWTLQEVEQTELEYRRFLQGIRLAKTSLAPSKNVDVFWHHHILDTRKYIADCNLLFGQYIHHYPYSGVFGDEDASLQKQRFESSQNFLSQLKEQK